MPEPHPRSGMVVNSAVANVYGEPAFSAELVTQAVLGERPQVIDQRGKWYQVRQWDGYEGWLYYFYMIKNPEFLVEVESVTVTAAVAPIRKQPADNEPVIREAVFSCRLPVLDRRDPWVQVALPDGLTGWLQPTSEQLSGTRRERIVQVARQFLGAPYFWGGKTPKGFDCSGLVQTCFKALGVDLPRNSGGQHRIQELPAVELGAAQPGDLLFFSESDGQVSHVGIATGGGGIIHSSGWVKEESLEPDSPAYNHLLRGIFLQGRDTSELLHE